MASDWQGSVTSGGQWSEVRKRSYGARISDEPTPLTLFCFAE